MSSTANICETNNDESIGYISKYNSLKRLYQMFIFIRNENTEIQEDITAWIEERKRKWPTDKNIQKKV